MLRKLTIQSLFFFIVLGILGTILRIKMTVPFLHHLRFDYLLHAHSHIAILGWTNVAFIALIAYFTFKQERLNRPTFLFFFWATWIVNLGIVPSFMLQGYGLYSIIFSTLSIVLSFWFLILYFKYRTENARKNISSPFLMTGVILFALSAIGLMMVAVHMAAKIGGQALFNAGVYFYLHSQYNGWMFFIIIGTVYSYLSSKGIELPSKKIKSQWLLFTISFLPTYVPQILSLSLPSWIVAVGITGVIISLVATLLFLHTTYKPMLRLIHNYWARLLYRFSMIALLVKATLEVGGAFPTLADMILMNRQVIIGYLHLTLLGLISTYLVFAIYHYVLKQYPSIKLVSLLYLPATLLMIGILFLDGLLGWQNLSDYVRGTNVYLAVVSGAIVCSALPLLFQVVKAKCD